MKKLFTGFVLLLFLLCYSALTANAEIVSIDFDSLPTGEIPLSGIDLGDVDIFGQLMNDIFDDDFSGGTDYQRMIGVFPGTIIFKFAPSLMVDEITATIRSNAASATLQAIGTEGSAVFSLDGNTLLENSFTETLGGIGVIDTVLFSGWESFIIDFSYNSNSIPTPIPSALILLGSGLLGMVGIRRKKIITR